MKNRALFLDRDGVLNELVYYDGKPHSPRFWEEVKHYDGLDELPKLRELGFLLILVTNQPDIERGIIPQKFVDELNEHYRQRYQLDAIYCSPHQADTHPWKKPNPKPASRSGSLSPAQKARAKQRAKAAGRPYPNLVDNMAVARKGNASKRASGSGAAKNTGGH